MSLSKTVIDIGPEGMEGNTSFLGFLGTGHFRTPQAPREADFNALGITFFDSIGNGLLHGPPERRPGQKLTSHILGDNLGVVVGIPDFFNLDLDFLGYMLPKLDADLFDIGALDADDNPRPGGVNGNRDTLGMPDNFQLRDVGALGFRHI
jgi:hypothetical protein